MIQARGLARSFRTRKTVVEAVRGVDLDVDPGEIVGFLGPNGAGKTTTLRMLTTLLTPTAGEATVAGHDLRTDPVAVRRRIGYVAQGGVTAPEARVGEELVDQAQLFGLSARDATRRGQELLGQLDLADVWARPTGSLSGGQRRRLDIAMGLVHGPGLIFLDEPTAGLDPQSRANLWEHIRRLRAERDTTVFLTTHYLEEADALCDRVMVIDHGAIVAEGRPEDLKREFSDDTITLSLLDAADAGRTAAVAAAVGAEEQPVEDPAVVSLRVRDGGATLPRLLRELDAAGVTLAGVEVRRPTLDDVFLSLTGRTLRDDTAAA